MTPESCLEQLKTKVTVVDYIIAQEEHKDEGLHLHCWIKCPSKVNIKDQHTLDIVGEDNKVFHGSYEGVRSNIKVLKYCTKDGKYISSQRKEDLMAQVKAREKHASVVGLRLVEEGRLTSDMIKEYPQLLVSSSLQRI